MSRRAVTVQLPKGVTRVTRRGKDYWYFQERRGQPDAGPRTRLPEYGTPEFWAAIARLTEIPAEQGMTMARLVEDFKKEPEWTSRRANTQLTYGFALKPILEAWGHLHPAQINISGINGLRKKFADRPNMGNLILAVIRLLMKYAIGRELRTDNPAREIGRLAIKPDEAKPLSGAAWLAAISDKAPIAVRRYAVLARATGQRISDVIRMRPADRDQDGIQITITKLGDKPHWCLLRPEESATIDGWKVFENACYVTRKTGRRHTEDSLRDEWNAYAATDDGSALRGFTPHDLRATKVCDERIRGKNHQQIAALVGMSVEMVMKYSRHIDQRLAARGTA